MRRIPESGLARRRLRWTTQVICTCTYAGNQSRIKTWPTKALMLLCLYTDLNIKLTWSHGIWLHNHCPTIATSCHTKSGKNPSARYHFPTAVCSEARLKIITRTNHEHRPAKLYPLISQIFNLQEAILMNVASEAITTALSANQSSQKSHHKLHLYNVTRNLFYFRSRSFLTEFRVVTNYLKCIFMIKNIYSSVCTTFSGCMVGCPSIHLEIWQILHNKWKPHLHYTLPCRHCINSLIFVMRPLHHILRMDSNCSMQIGESLDKIKFCKLCSRTSVINLMNIR